MSDKENMNANAQINEKMYANVQIKRTCTLIFR